MRIGMLVRRVGEVAQATPGTASCVFAELLPAPLRRTTRDGRRGQICPLPVFGVFRSGWYD